jgi:hypothetical protein
MSHLTVGEASKRLGCKPRQITWAIYDGTALADVDVPIVGGRRMIPESSLPQLKAELQKAGKLPAEKAGAA